MAPEFAPSLVIFNSRFDNGVLKGVVEYVESAKPDHRLRVRWSVEGQPKDYRSVGGGVAYIYDKDGELNILPISEDASAMPLGNHSYLWTEGLQFGRPWLMFILILPRGYTLANPRPLPVGTKIFEERLALYWTLRGDDLERTKVEWTIKELKGNLGSEIIQLNKDYLSGRALTPLTIEIEDAAKSVTTLDRPSPPIARTGQPQTKVFVSYSHRDEKWLKMLQTHLTPLVRSNVVEFWDDTKIAPGQKWRSEINNAIRSARVAVLLISPEFMASDFIANNELPPLLAAAAGQGVVVLPVIISPCDMGSLSDFQAVNSLFKPLVKMGRGDRDKVWIKLVGAIKSALTE